MSGLGLLLNITDIPKNKITFSEAVHELMINKRTGYSTYEE
jgi:hypothetical protein